jgi:hypothetical protein
MSLKVEGGKLKAAINTTADQFVQGRNITEATAKRQRLRTVWSTGVVFGCGRSRRSLSVTC